MLDNLAFIQNGATRAVTAATTPPAAVQVPATFTFGTRPRNQIRVANAGTEVVFFGMGPSAAIAAANAAEVTTTGNAIPILAGSVEVFSVPPDWYFTAGTAANTSVVYITPGEGL